MMKPFFTLALVCIATRLFCQLDTVPPTLYCLSGLSVNIQPTAKIEVWATEFLGYATDNQTPQAEIVISICDTCLAISATTENLSFECSSLGLHPVRVWARDLAGNTSYCDNYVIVQDNNCNCPTNGNSNVASLEVKSSTNSLTSFEICYNYRRPTFFWGCAEKDTVVDIASFELRVHPTEATYVQPQMQADIRDGVDMLDVLKIHRHLKGLEVFTNPYKLLAADVNQDGKVTTADLEEVRAVALNQAQAFSSGLTVKFYNKDDVQFPFRDYALAVKGRTCSFEAVKLGDVTGNAAFDRSEVEEMIESTPPLSISPNPFSQAAVVQYHLPKAQKVIISVFDSMGRLVHTDAISQNAGQQTWLLDGALLTSQGWYSLQIATESEILQAKAMHFR